jgi:hypothetical protein
VKERLDMQRSRLRGLAIISIAIFVGGIVFIALGIGVLNKAANVSGTAAQDYLNNKTSGTSGMKSTIKSTIANTVIDAFTPYIQTLTHVSKGIMASIGAFFCLVGVGICVLGTGLFKVKYLAWILTVVLMFVAIIIDVVGLGFVGGSLPSSSNEKCIMSVKLANALIGILIAHLFANAFIIYYLTRKKTASIFRT